jgi:hypothetical protein
MKTRGAWGAAVKSVCVAAVICGGLLPAILGGAGTHAVPGSARSVATTASKLAKWQAVRESPGVEAYGKLPLSFEENEGQTAQEVRFVSHGGGYELFLTPQEVVLALRPKQNSDLSPLHRAASIRAMRIPQRAQPITAVRMQLEGANPNPEMAGLERLPARVNYFFGNDPKKWHTEVPAFARVKYAEVYRGVDVVFYGNQRRLEYDFIVAPGASPKAIRLKIDGAQKLRINSRGDLILSVAGGEMQFRKPLIYQEVRGERRKIAGNYTIDGLHRVTFSVPSYDHSVPLILDPVLDYATYLGGAASDVGYAIAVDASGNAFIAGQTLSTDFPAGTNGAVTAAPSTNSGASFVAELDPTGANLLYSTYLAGSTTNAAEGAFGLALDPSGRVYVTGVTFATDFPTTAANAFNAGPLATNANGTVYLTKLDPTVSGTSSLVYSTYIAGTGGDFANGVAADAAGNAYVVGLTDSTNFPTANSLQSAPSNTHGTAFITRIDTTKTGGASLIFSTYFGGNGANAAAVQGLGFGDSAFGVATDSVQHAYLVGATSSTDSPATFITSGTAYQATPPAANTLASVFVSNIDTTAGSLVYSTYLAGSASDEGFALGLGPSNVAYVTGSTASIDFPVAPNPGAFETTGAASGKAFVTLVVVDGTKSGTASVPYSTYLGGTAGNNGFAIKADASGNAYVAGTTASTDFPLAPGPLQATLLDTAGDAFVAKLNPAGGGASDLLYSTYYGGSGDGTNADQAFGMAIDSVSPPNVYITGQTFSTNLPVLSALPKGASLQGPSDAYVAKLTLIPTLSVAPSPFSFGSQQLGVKSTSQPFLVTNNTSSGVTFNSIVVTGVSPVGNTDFAISSDGCSPSVAAGAPPCAVNVTFTPSVAAAESATLVITAVVTNGGQSSTDTFSVNLTGTGSATAPGIGFDHTTVAFTGQMLTTTSAAMTVKVTNTGLGPLTINSIAASGDFAQTNTCPASSSTLAAAGTCTINITFAPTATGARTGTLTVTDNASGSPQTIPLTGTGWDFQVTASSPQTGKSPLTFNATMTPLGGFNQSVAFACTGAPAGTTCAIATPVTAADGKTAQSVQVTVTRTGSALLIPLGPVRTPLVLMREIVPLILALLLLFLLPKARSIRLRLGLATAMVLLMALAGCSGSGHPAPIAGNLTITGTSNGTAGTVSHSVSVGVDVN